MAVQDILLLVAVIALLLAIAFGGVAFYWFKKDNIGAVRDDLSGKTRQAGISSWKAEKQAARGNNKLARDKKISRKASVEGESGFAPDAPTAVFEDPDAQTRVAFAADAPTSVADAPDSPTSIVGAAEDKDSPTSVLVDEANGPDGDVADDSKTVVVMDAVKQTTSPSGEFSVLKSDVRINSDVVITVGRESGK